MLDAYLAVLRAQWSVFVNYGWVVVPISLLLITAALLLDRHTEE